MLRGVVFVHHVRRDDVNEGHGNNTLFERDGRTTRGREDESALHLTAPLRDDLRLGSGDADLSCRPTHSHVQDLTIRLDSREWRLGEKARKTTGAERQ